MAGIDTEILTNLMQYKLQLYRVTGKMAWNIASGKTGFMKLAVRGGTYCVKRELSCVKRELSCVKRELSCVKRELPCVRRELSCVKRELPCVRRELSCVKRELSQGAYRWI